MKKHYHRVEKIMQARYLFHVNHAKRLVAALQDNIERYESVYGEIKAVTPPGMPDHLNVN